MDPLRIINNDGSLAADSHGLTVTEDLTIELYTAMRLARRFDEESLHLQRQGELGLWLMSLGQEAAQVGSVSALRSSDYVFPSYREHAAALFRGIGPEELLVQWRGNRHSGWDPAHYRFHVYTLVLAAQLLHATGFAIGSRLENADEVTLAYFGDGSSSEGDANEALNWAAVHDAPIVFFCQNNQWAISTPTSAQMRNPLHLRAAGFGMRTYLVDGNDVLAVRAATEQAVEHARTGGGPVLIEALTYRMAGHSTSDDPNRYRSADELDDWLAKDPLARVESVLARHDWLSSSAATDIKTRCDDLATETRRKCLAMTPGPIDELFQFVLSTPTPSLTAERHGLRSYLDSFEEAAS